MGLCWLFKNHGGPRMGNMFAGYPAWTYWCSYVHCFLLLPIAAMWLLVDHPPLSDLGLHEYGPPEQPHSRATTTAYVLIMGYLLRDFHAYPEGLELAYVAHHVFTVFGCLVCMYFPLLAGMVGIFGVQAEVASGTYNVQTMWPNKWTRLLYVAAMGASQVCCGDNTFCCGLGNVFLDHIVGPF